jgi:hypothetical protein
MSGTAAAVRLIYRHCARRELGGAVCSLTIDEKQDMKVYPGTSVLPSRLAGRMVGLDIRVVIAWMFDVLESERHKRDGPDSSRRVGEALQGARRPGRRPIGSINSDQRRCKGWRQDLPAHRQSREL